MHLCMAIATLIVFRSPDDDTFHDFHAANPC